MKLAFTLLISVATDGPFVELDFDTAREVAARDGTDLLIYFSEPGHGQCKIYADATWGDEAVRSWLADHATAIELSLSEHQALAKRFGVEAVPAVVLLDSSGATKALIAGFRMPSSLLRSLDKALLATGAPTDSPGSSTPHMSLVKQGESLESQGRYAEAMGRYLACMNQPEGVSGVLTAKTRAVRGMGRLASVHPPALRALEDRRNEMHGRIIASEANPSDAALFLALTKALRAAGAPAADGATGDVLRARSLAKAGRAAEALVVFLGVLDAEAQRSGAALAPKLLVIVDVGSLGQKHPPALAALRVRRDRIRQRMLALEANRSDPGLLVAISDQLGDLEQCLDLCRRLGLLDQGGIVTRLLCESTAHALVAVGRYDDAIGLIDALAAINVARAQLEKDLAQPLPSGRSSNTVHRFLRGKFVAGVVPLYEMLVGGGKQSEASDAAGVILGASSDADTHAALASAGLRTMKPTDANVEQARRAMELAPSGNAERIELLVLILQTMQRADEAKEVVATHIDRVSDPEAKRSLQRLVDLAP